MLLDKEEKYKTKYSFVKKKKEDKLQKVEWRALNCDYFSICLQKLIAVILVTLNIVIIRADISLKLSAANQFEGYNYPKPRTPFITGNLKSYEPETTSR